MSRTRGRKRRFGRSQTPPWLVILFYVVGTLVLGLTLPRLEAGLLPDFTLGLSPSAALSFCGAIASGMLALTGIVFSLSFVMVQFSSAAYSPRLVQWFAKDPVVTHATGIFTATFLYALMTTAWIDREGSGRVPLFSGMVVFLLLIASIFAFTGLIHRVGMLQISHVLAYIGDRGREIIAEMYPPLEDAVGVLRPPEPKPAGPWVQSLTYKGPPRVVAAVDVPTLVTVGQAAGGVVVLRFAVGSTVLEGDILAQLSGSAPVPDRDLLACIHLTQERTFEQDPKYALRLLVDVAIKALSPAINDPTTAVQAIDQLEDHLRRLGVCKLDVGRVKDPAGVLRLVFPVPSWEDFLRLAFEEIRACGAGSVQVMRRMRGTQNALLASVPETRQEAVRDALARLDATVGRSYSDPSERSDALVGDRQGLGLPAQTESGD
jgi:uncharacterized membrane protein